MDYDLPRSPIVQQIEKVKAAEPAKRKEGQFTVPAPKTGASTNRRQASVPAPAPAVARTPPALAFPKPRPAPEVAKPVAENAGTATAPIARLVPDTGAKSPPARGQVEIEDIPNEELGAFVKRLAKANPGFKAGLKSDYAKAAHSPVLLNSTFRNNEAELSVVATDNRQPPPWRERERGINAAQFIQKYYGELIGKEWHHRGCTRADLKKNPGLYGAYSDWISDHPEDVLAFAPGGGRPVGRPRKLTADDDRRERDRERKREIARRVNLTRLGPI